MNLDKTERELLRNILEHLHNPGMLDNHPWVSRFFVKEAVARNAGLEQRSPGEQLAVAVGDVFAETMPAVPPRRGKRLDNHWGAFGILASQYFVPSQQGCPGPVSLREAWGAIDRSILLYVFGSNGQRPSAEAVRAYKLVGDEPQIAPVSTLSDWHRKGIERLRDAIASRERHLARLSSGSEAAARSNRKSSLKRIILLSLLLVVAAGVVWLANKSYKIYHLALIVKSDAGDLQNLMASPAPDLQTVQEAGTQLSVVRQDFDALQAEVEPWLWLGPWLGWVPEYGGELESSRELLALADHLLESGEASYQALQPLFTVLESGETVTPRRMVELLQEAQPRLSEAKRALDQAMQVRAGLDVDRFSARVQSILEGDLDHLLPVMDDSLDVSLALPGFLGASSSGPRTYLLLVQNEDELRPTGGFITAVGTLVIQDGQVLDVSFIDSGELDNWDYPYPISPWQLEEYMNSPVLVLRDSNWFADFPTSALYAEMLYAYNYSHSVDGVIAFDQHMLVLILQALGPLEVPGHEAPVDAGNIISYMRAAKSPPAGQPVPAGWSRKAFMDEITKAMLGRVLGDGDLDWEKMGHTALQGLEQRHLLIQLDDAALSKVIANRGWNGALVPGDGDYLRVVDANVGFNKTSALVDTSMIYDVDLTVLTTPVAHLTVVHRNNSRRDVECIQWGAPRLEGEQEYPINACYWNYMRIYKPVGTQLLDAAPQTIPDEWMLLGRGLDGRVDVPEDDVEGLQAFGTLMVVPGSDSVLTEFSFALPGGILKTLPGSDQVIYHLKLDKQPGTIAVPVTLRIHLPNGSLLESVPAGAIVDGNHILLETSLLQDLDLELVFRPK